MYAIPIKVVVLLSGLFWSSLALAQAYPSKPVRLIVGSSAGGATDITARIISLPMGKLWNQPIIVDNRSAGQIFGLDLTAHSNPDGYTISVAASSGYVNGVLTTKLPFDLKNDLEPIVQLTSQPYVLVVHPSLKVKTVVELIALAKSKPAALNFASSGTGAASHMGMELLKSMTNTNMVHVPYKGAGPAYVDLLAGRVHMYMGSPVSSMQYVRSGKLNVLAVSTEGRSKFLPDIPTLSESGIPTFDLDSWYGLVGPKGISSVHIQAIFQAAKRVLAESDVQAKFEADAAEVAMSSSPAEFKKVVLKEIDKWDQFGKKMGIKLE